MGMRINLNNYEEFFLSYLDGNLGDNEIMELEKFLLANPGLREELEGLENVVLVPGEKNFYGKENLKQIDLSLPVTLENFDFFCAAEQENDLTQEQIEELDRFTDRHTEKKKDRETYRSAHLVPRVTDVFHGKSELRKSILIVYRKELMTTMAMAAGIALLAGVYFGFLENKISPEQTAVAVNPVKKTAVDSSAMKKSISPVIVSPEKKEKTSSPGKAAGPSEKKSSPSGFSFKVEMPVAAAESSGESQPVDERQILKRVRIAPERLRESPLAILHPQQDRLELINTGHSPDRRKISGVREEYHTMESMARQKLGNLVFGDEVPKEITVWNVVTAGLEKVNDLTGSNMKLERQVDTDGDTRALKFESRLLKISAPVNNGQ